MWQIFPILYHWRKEVKSLSTTPSVLTYTIDIRISLRRFIFTGAQIRQLYAQLHDSPTWPTPRQWCAQTVSLLLMFLIFPQSGYNSRVKAFHIVNASPWAETVIAILKFVLKNKIAGRVSVIQYTEFGKSTYYISINRVSQEECARLREGVPYVKVYRYNPKHLCPSWTVTEIMAREVWNFDSCYTLIDYQIHIKTGRNMWFL